MMRLGIEAGSHTLAVAQEHSIRGVPVSAEQLVQQGVETVLQPLRDCGLQVCQIGAFGFNPLSQNSAAQEKQREILAKAIPLANAVGCRYLVINGGNYHPNGFGGVDPRNFTPQALDQVAKELEPFIGLAENHGVFLSIEPYLKTAICSAEQFLALKSRLPSPALRVNIDVTSLYGVQEMFFPDSMVEQFCISLAGCYGLVHIKDIVLKEGFHIHMELGPLGSTPTDWARLLELVSPNLPEDSWVILEHIQTPSEAAASLKLLHEAAQQAGVRLE